MYVVKARTNSATNPHLTATQKEGPQALYDLRSFFFLGYSFFTSPFHAASLYSFPGEAGSQFFDILGEVGPQLVGELRADMVLCPRVDGLQEGLISDEGAADPAQDLGVDSAVVVPRHE